MSDKVNWGYLIALQATPAGGPVPAWYGLPGGGKTAVVRALAHAARRRFLPMIASQKMPEDFGGVPSPDDIVMADGSSHRGVRHLLSEDILRSMHEPSIILLDEFNHAGHDVMGAAQEWINNPPPACWMGMAMNPVECSTSGVELAPPVVNRLCVLQFQRPTKARRAGWLNGFTDYPAPHVPLLPDGFLAQGGPAWGATMCRFEDDNPDLFGDEAYPKDASKACDPWPSDRSWTHIGILMAACDAVGAGKMVRADLVTGCVGEAAATQFLQWIGRQDLPDFEELLAMPHQLKLPQRFDLSRAIIGGVIGCVRGERTPSRWEACYDVLEVAFEQQPDTAMAALGAFWKVKPGDYQPRERNGAAAEMNRLLLGNKETGN